MENGFAYVNWENVETHLKPPYCKKHLEGKRWYVYLTKPLFSYNVGDIVIAKTLNNELEFHPEFEYAINYFERKEKLERICK